MPTRSFGEIKAEQDIVRTRVGQLVDQKRELEIKIDVDGATDGLTERLGTVERGIEKAGRQLEALKDEHRAEIGRRVANGSVRTESEQDAIERSRPASETRVQSDMDPHRRAAFDVGMRTLERCQTSGVMFHTAAERMEAALRHSDPSGTTARYIAAVGADAYNSAFGKLLQYGSTASMRMTAEEMAAMQRVSQVESERVMSDGTTTAGGFAIPIGIDPTINLTSSGALCPVREVADVRQITTHELRLVSADTPASTYAAGVTEDAGA